MSSTSPINSPSSPPTSPSNERRSSRSKSTPSLFSNEHSRGPLYQYWRERNREAQETRARRVLDAKERSRGKNPQYPEPGPSSNSEYANRLDRGLRTPATPAYEATDSTPRRHELGGEAVPEWQGEDELPAYVDVSNTTSNLSPTTSSQSAPATHNVGSGFGASAADEKERLQRHYERQQNEADEAAVQADLTADDAALAAAIQNEERMQETQGSGKGKEKERKKSIGSKFGNFMGAAFTGYNMKSDGKGNVNRW